MDGDVLHVQAAVVGVGVGLRAGTTAAPAASRHLAAEHSSQRHSELLTEPAVDDEVDGRLEGEQQHGEQLEHEQGARRLAETTNTHHRRVHHVRSLSIQHAKQLPPCNALHVAIGVKG